MSKLTEEEKELLDTALDVMENQIRDYARTDKEEAEQLAVIDSLREKVLFDSIEADKPELHLVQFRIRRDDNAGWLQDSFEIIDDVCDDGVWFVTVEGEEDRLLAFITLHKIPEEDYHWYNRS